MTDNRKSTDKSSEPGEEIRPEAPAIPIDSKAQNADFRRVQFSQALGQDESATTKYMTPAERAKLAEQGKGAKFELVDPGAAPTPNNDIPQAVQHGFHSVVEAVEQFDKWVRSLAAGPAKDQAMQALADMKRIADGEDKPGADHKPGINSLTEAAELGASTSINAVRGMGHAADHLTKDGLVKDILGAVIRSKDSVGTAAGYYADKAKHIHEVPGESIDAATYALRVQNEKAKEHQALGPVERGAHIGIATGTAFFFAKLGHVVEEAKAAELLQISEKQLEKLSKEKLKELEITKIEPVKGRMPCNYAFAGQVMKFEGELGKKYPDGIYFKPNGFPDFFPYKKDLARIKVTGDRRQDNRAANRDRGYSETPQGMVWHHVEDSNIMLLVPLDLHRAVSHTGGVATRGRKI